MSRLSLRGYAAHRKARGLNGTTHTAVLRAIDSGRLTTAAAEKDERGRWRIDPERADAEWTDATVATKQRGDAHRGGRAAADAGPALFPELEPDRAPSDEPTQAERFPSRAAGTSSTMRRSVETRALYEALRSKLRYQQEAGRLVDASAVRRESFTIARQTRDEVLGVVKRVASLVATLEDPRKVGEVLTDELEGALRRVTAYLEEPEDDAS